MNPSSQAVASPDQTSGLSPKPIGLVGIGLMGIVLAERLMRAGFSVLGWDINPDCRRRFAEQNGRVASGLDEVFSTSDRILLSLPSHENVAEVLDAVSPALHGGQTIIDLSTGDPSAAAQRAQALASRQIDYLDATVSGSSEQLRSGVAVLLVGAENHSFAACRDVLDCLGQKVFHTGVPGSGAKMKLVTNLVLGLNRAALAEGLCFAEHLGLDLKLSLHLLRESMSYSRIMDGKGEKMLLRDFSPQARLSQHLKDVRLMVSAAGPGAYLPLTGVHQKLLERAEEIGLGALDNSVIIEVLRGNNQEVLLQ